MPIVDVLVTLVLLCIFVPIGLLPLFFDPAQDDNLLVQVHE